MKKILSATIDEELLKRIDCFLKEHREYRNKSHLIEQVLYAFMEGQEEGSSGKRKGSGVSEKRNMKRRGGKR